MIVNTNQPPIGQPCLTATQYVSISVTRRSRPSSTWLAIVVMVKISWSPTSTRLVVRHDILTVDPVAVGARNPRNLDIYVG